ncbi:MAG: carboxylesterase/lipase family protein [Rhodospirillales bacterium]|nr:carboxylesterase/lipase family protein [Rhodospirillales bacterium]
MTVAKTGLGDLRGLAGDGVIRFRGLAYARASRFGRPHAAASVPAEALAHGPIPPQPPSRLRAAMGDYDLDQGEDCLTLTIATPALSGSRPVIVVLHGGAYLSGAGSLAWYDGATLARDGDCVVVGVNYRLGALGWLHLPPVSQGNNGLHDMLAALRFVRAHIAAFGGDPERVTLLGQSAGAHAIMCLLAMEEARGLLHRAILQSAPPAMTPLSAAVAQAYGTRLAELAEVEPEGLRSLPVPALMAAQLRLAQAIAAFADVRPPFLPVFDALAEPHAFIAAAARGAAERGVPLIVGTTREEMHAFFVPDRAMGEPDPLLTERRFRELAGETALARYRAWRPGGAAMELLGDLVTDHMFQFPSLALAEAVARAGGTAFAYRFDWSVPGNPFRACHCIELPFVFGTFHDWPDAGMLRGGDAGEMQALAASLRAAWAGFAHRGDPAMAALPWPAYEPARRMTRLFDRVISCVGDPAGMAWRHNGGTS